MMKEFKPDALTLDLHLPDIDGWRVLDRLKNDVQTRHVPVCVISTDEARERALTSGAFAFVGKPVKTKETLDELLSSVSNFVHRPQRTVLLIDQSPDHRRQLLELLEGGDLEVTCGGKEDAYPILRQQRVDGMILATAPHELDRKALGDALRERSDQTPLPAIVFADGPGARDSDSWKRFADILTIRQTHSPERLLDQVCLFLHRNMAKLPESKRQMLEGLHSSAKALPGKKVLIVDDDMRNIFALQSVLEDHEMVIVSADNGRDAIKVLQTQSDIDIVLMDIMMPEMDGIDTMREIRKIPHLKSLPIIAVTAKAMKGDREKCIEAGAWDYLSKPVDPEQMLALLRAWLHR